MAKTEEKIDVVKILEANFDMPTFRKELAELRETFKWVDHGPDKKRVQVKDPRIPDQALRQFVSTHFRNADGFFMDLARALGTDLA